MHVAAAAARGRTKFVDVNEEQPAVVRAKLGEAVVKGGQLAPIQLVRARAVVFGVAQEWFLRQGRARRPGHDGHQPRGGVVGEHARSGIAAVVVVHDDVLYALPQVESEPLVQVRRLVAHHRADGHTSHAAV